MGKVIDIAVKKQKLEGAEFTKEVPEHATLLQLAASNYVRAFQGEIQGAMMCFVHFERNGENFLYTDGDGLESRHLFFYLLSWEDERTPEEMASVFYEDVILDTDGNEVHWE